MMCPWCKANNVIKKGVRKTKYFSHQRYFCKDCGKYFSNNPLKHKWCLIFNDFVWFI